MRSSRELCNGSKAAADKTPVPGNSSCTWPMVQSRRRCMNSICPATFSSGPCSMKASFYMCKLTERAFPEALMALRHTRCQQKCTSVLYGIQDAALMLPCLLSSVAGLCQNYLRPEGNLDMMWPCLAVRCMSQEVCRVQ